MLLTGGAGMLGRSIGQSWRRQRADDELVILTRADVDLTDRVATEDAVRQVAPDTIVHAAAAAGGIAAKLSEPTNYLLNNLLIDTSVVSAALEAGVRELLYVSSGAIYPEGIRQPIVESDVLSGRLESANEGYGLAKITGAKLCEMASRQFGFAYRAIAPSNLYGPNDDYAPGRAHLIAATIAKVHAAAESGSDSVEVWGDGTARREFTYVADLADWLVENVGNLASWPPCSIWGAGLTIRFSSTTKQPSESSGTEVILPSTGRNPQVPASVCSIRPSLVRWAGTRLHHSKKA